MVVFSLFNPTAPAFKHAETIIEGQLPEGGRDQASIRVSPVVVFLVMKGAALHDSLKEKDAWNFISR